MKSGNKCRMLFVLLTCATALTQSCGSTSDSSSSSSAPGARQATALALGPTYTSIFQNIFTPKCISCHSGGSARGNTDLTSYDSLVHSSRHSDLVVPSNPDSSHLFEMIQSGKMPPNGPPLSAEELQAISKWIETGAPNN